jgi:hypothetical protein
MIWMTHVRAQLPDAKVWPGRHAFALIDAIAWPAMWAAFASQLPVPGGVAGLCLLAICTVATPRRAYRAVMHNHRYHFTTWRWGRHLTALLAVGYALKLATVMFSG